MKLNGIALAAFLMVGGSAFGALVSPCTAGNTLTAYLASGYECEIGDNVYSNFSYTDPVGDPGSDQIIVGVDDQPGISQTGLQFQGTGNTWTVGGFAISYSISIPVCVSPFVFFGTMGTACSLTAAQLSFQGALAPNDAAMNAIFSPGGTIAVDDLDFRDNTNQINLGSQPLTATNVVINGLYASTSAPIDSFGLDVYQTITSSAPEPASLGLVGMGLIGLGLLGRRLS
jgi:hypothetical protein